jgi:hypothetical protein
MSILTRTHYEGVVAMLEDALGSVQIRAQTGLWPILAILP